MNNLAQELTNENVTNMVTNAQFSNLVVWAFVLFTLIFIGGIITIVSIFNRSQLKRDTIQSTTLNSFRTTIENIGEVLRQLSQNISKQEATNSAEDDKMEIVLDKMESINQTFQLHEQNTIKELSSIRSIIENNTAELKRNTEWCKSSQVVKRKSKNDSN